jgi:hypothetical protein
LDTKHIQFKIFAQASIRTNLARELPQQKNTMESTRRKSLTMAKQDYWCSAGAGRSLQSPPSKIQRGLDFESSKKKAKSTDYTAKPPIYHAADPTANPTVGSTVEGRSKSTAINVDTPLHQNQNLKAMTVAIVTSLMFLFRRQTRNSRRHQLRNLHSVMSMLMTRTTHSICLLLVCLGIETGRKMFSTRIRIRSIPTMSSNWGIWAAMKSTSGMAVMGDQAA